MRIDGMQVTIAGGAIGGSAAALLLARAGAQVTLFERVAQPRAVGAGLAIAANGSAVLESIGLAPALASAIPVAQPRIVDGAGRLLLTPPGDAGIRMVRRATLHRILLDAIAAEPRITTHFGVAVLAATPRGRVTFVGPHGHHAEHTSDLVVAADGVHSQLRAGLDVGATVRRTGINYLRTLVQAPATNEEAWTSAGLFGNFAVEGATYVFASAGNRDTRAAIDARDLNALRAGWHRAYPASTTLLAGVSRWDQLIVDEVTTVECARWSHGRVVLLGDAAHAMAPNLGQGANSALVDAAVLLDSLRAAADIPSALDAYERRRRPAVMRVAHLARRLGVIAEETRPPVRWLRDRLLLPLARRGGRDTTALVLQEDPATLLAIGRAAA